MKRRHVATFAAGALAFAVSLGQPAAAHAGWGFGFDFFAPSGGFGYHHYEPIYAPPIYAPPPVGIYHFHPAHHAPACYAPLPCFDPYRHRHHHHHHHYGW
jgi:hypothetical protein